MDFDVALIGFGEAAMTFALSAGWRDRATAYDRKTDDRRTLNQKLADYAAAGIIDSLDAAEAAGSSDVLLSLVTADQSIDAAQSAASGLRRGALFCDANSVAPDTKRQTARIIEEAGGRYVDMAILAPVHPARLSVPILLSGLASDDAMAVLRGLGFDAVRVVGNEVGRASSIKMIRSVIVKGIEALTAECVLAASRADVLEEVLTSLDASEKARPWRERADYNLDRMLVHGLRRAAELEEVAKTLSGLGIEPDMTRGTIQRQLALGKLNVGQPQNGLETKLDIIEQRGSKAA